MTFALKRRLDPKQIGNRGRNIDRANDPGLRARRYAAAHREEDCTHVGVIGLEAVAAERPAE